MYRPNGGGRRAPLRKLTLGNARVLTPEAARDAAETALAEVKLGSDPAALKSQKKREMTVSELCDLYLEEGTTTKKPSTLATDRGRIDRHIKPLLGKKLVTEVSHADVERFLRDVASGKTKADIKTKPRGVARVRGGQGTASRTLGLLGGIFSFAVRRKLRNDNPVRGVERFKDRKGERFLSPQELAKLGKALNEVQKEGANSTAITIIRLLVLTGARKSEIVALKASEIDLAHACLRLGDSKMDQR
jgi:integrase